MPRQQVQPGPVVTRVAWQAPPDVMLQADRLVSLGQNVRQGEALFQDRHAPDVLHVAPSSGTITKIVRGENQSLMMIEIAVTDEKGKTFQRLNSPFDAADVRHQLQCSGLWAQIRERPFDTMPRADAVPEAIFVTALDTRPLAADPVVAIATDTQAMTLGLEALTSLTDGPVYLCQAPGKSLLKNMHERVQAVAFAGPHPAGLPGIHIQTLYPVDRQHRVWHLDCQDVMAIGRLLRDGSLSNQRVVALAGDQILNPRLIECPMFANIGELLHKQAHEGYESGEVIAGSLFTGRKVSWLGRFDRQVSVMSHGKNHSIARSATAQAPTLSAPTPTVEDIDFRSDPNDSHNPDYLGFAAEPRFERVNAYDILPVPLMRALLCSDLEQSEALGCLELAPEDLETLSYICPAGNDYGAALSRCQAQLRDAHS